MIPVVSGNGKKRVIVDPAVAEAEDAFQRMMAWFKGMSREEHLKFEIEAGLRNPDGTFKLPEGDPCVTRV
jgi:hypothetical protein